MAQASPRRITLGQVQGLRFPGELSGTSKRQARRRGNAELSKLLPKLFTELFAPDNGIGIFAGEALGWNEAERTPREESLRRSVADTGHMKRPLIKARVTADSTH
jgi:hypothetical protein